MKKIKKNKTKIPAYAFGINQIGNAMGNYAGVADMAGGVTSAFGEAGSGADIAGGAISGAAKGASMGMAAGPIGAVAGGVLGLAGGLFTGFNKRKKIREQKRRQQNVKDTQIGMNNMANMESEYWDDNTLAYTYANGGVIPSDLAYLDNNEIIRDDFGNITQVPNNKPGTDNHLVDASNLESVLSDKIKRPGTNKTFAQEGEKLTRMTKPSKGKDKFAETANKLNTMNANRKYNQLLAEQEEVKARKGTKAKVKGIPAYADGKANYGGYGSNLKADWGWLKNLSNQFADWGKDFLLTPAAGTAVNETLARAYSNTSNKRGLGATDNLQPNLGNAGKYLLPNGGTYRAQKAAGYNRNYGTGSINLDYNVPVQYNSTFNPVGTPEVEISDYSLTVPEPILNTGISATNASVPKTTVRNKVTNKVAKATTPSVNRFNKVNTPPVQVFEGELPQLPKAQLATPKAGKLLDTMPVAKKSKEKTKQFKEASFQNMTGSLLDLAPTLYNAIQGIRDPEVEQNVTNPYASTINSTMARRRMNINPAIEANRRSRAIANYNASNTNANTGSNLAFRTQAAVSEYANNADMYATKQNADNAYLGEYANTLNNLGQQWVQGQVLTNDINARNRSAARSYTDKAINQLGQWSQARRQEANQYNRDQMMLPFLADFLKQGYTSDMVNSLYNKTKKM